MMSSFWHVIADYWGGGFNQTSHREKWVSALGGMLAMGGVWWVSQHFLPPEPAMWLVASVGASIVLLFAVPHGALSQPWPVLGGQLVAAAIGVACARLIPAPLFAGAAAVGMTILAMFYLRCLHPPGGATALVAVAGGPSVHAMGFQFLVTPVLINLLIALALAIAFNNLFTWRRYPAALQRRAMPVTEERHAPIEHADFVYALSQLDSFVDASEHDLLRIYELATQQAYSRQFHPAEVRLGRYYSNGQSGEQWAVRQIVDESPSADPAKDQVIYRTVAGTTRRESGVMTRMEFARWVRYEVTRHGNGWKRVTS
jgi:CBS-domain-containing membrane protein